MPETEVQTQQQTPPEPATPVAEAPKPVETAPPAPAAPKPKDREAFYAREGLIEEPPKPPVQEPPKKEETPPEAPKEPPKEAPLLAGKYKSVNELEKAYLEAQKKISQQGAEVKEAVKDLKAAASDPKPLEQAVATVQKDDLPDPILDPKGFSEGVLRQATERLAEQQKTQELVTRWRSENKDISDLEDLVSLRILKDPRAYDPNTDRSVLVAEHTSAVRTLAGRYIDMGRQDEAAKRQAIPPSAPQRTVEEAPSNQGTPPPKDEVGEFVALRNSARRGRPLKSRG